MVCVPRHSLGGNPNGLCTDNVSVFNVLRKALDNLADLCDVVEDKFTVARDDFNRANPNGANVEQS